MGYNFIPCDRDQQFLLPPSLQEWLPEDHLARFVCDAVETLDLSSFYARRRSDGWGRAAYRPEMMVALLIYAYATGIRSSRAIERRCIEDIGFRFICANEIPDHATIARFVVDHDHALAELFDQVLRLACELKLLRLGTIALDSTRFAANASPGANRSVDSIRREVQDIIAQAQATDRDEDDRYGSKRGDELPRDLAHREDRLARLHAAQQRLEAEERARQQDYERRLEERARKERERGAKLGGRKPKPPQQRAREGVRSKTANTTDPDSRIMSTANGGYLQGYNAQVVATEDQIVIAADVTPDRNDYSQLRPLVEQAQDNLQRAGETRPIGVLTADAGYASESNFALQDDLGVELMIATASARNHSDAAPRGRIPKRLSPTGRMRRKLRTKRGRRLYRVRGTAVEPVFGHLRHRGGGRFRRRGHRACQCEFRFEMAVHNLLKLRTSGNGLPTRPHRNDRRRVLCHLVLARAS